MAADPQPATLLLAAVLDLQAATPLAQELVALRGRHLTLAADAVQRLGAPCLQVLLAARRTWREDGTAFRVKAPSAAFTAATALLGATTLLTEPAGDLF